MTTTTTPPVSLPDGAELFSDWPDWGYEYRIVWTAERSVPGHDAIVVGAAISRCPTGISMTARSKMNRRISTSSSPLQRT